MTLGASLGKGCSAVQSGGSGWHEPRIHSVDLHLIVRGQHQGRGAERNPSMSYQPSQLGRQDKEENEHQKAGTLTRTTSTSTTLE